MRTPTTLALGQNNFIIFPLGLVARIVGYFKSLQEVGVQKSRYQMLIFSAPV